MFTHATAPPSSRTLAAFLVALSSCGLYTLEPLAEEDDIEQVVLKIAVVPTDVRCIRITAAGPGRTAEREIETSGAVSLSQSLSGLPLGTVTFLGEAFTSDCTAVSKTTIAAWASQPVEASIVIGRLASVELVMVRNGRAKVEVGFTEEGSCTATGSTCRVNSECCSRRCTSGVCEVAEAGTSPARIQP
jgi:hypothetical protein